MDQHRARTLRDLLAGTPVLERAATFGSALRTSVTGITRGPGGLLLVGTPQDEPWHLAAHLAEDARRAGVPELVPTLVRHHVPDGAPPHLGVGLDRLGESGRSSTLFVVATDDPGEMLLERLADARRRGATLFAVHRGDTDVADLAHEQLGVPTGPLSSRRQVPELNDASRSIEVVQHLISLVSTDLGSTTGHGRWDRLRGVLRRR